MTPEDGEVTPEPMQGAPVPAAPVITGDPVLDGVLDRLEQVGRTLDKIAERLAVVSSRERLTRRLTWALGISLFLDVSLTVIVTILAITTTSQSNAIHQSQLSACALSNSERGQQILLWDHVLAVDTPPHPTAAERQVLTNFRTFVDQTFVPLDCAKLYP